MRSRKLVLPCLISAVIAIPATATAASSGSGEAASPVTLEQVDGGLHWYGTFSNPLPTNESYFPIAVWFESVTTQADVDKDKDAGLNTYVVLTGNSNLSLLRSNGMHGILGDNSGTGAETKAVFLSDEIDMTEGPAGCTTLQSQHNAGSSGNRATWANFGKGVIFWQTSSQAACFVDTPSIASNDIYWFTDTNACSSVSEGPSFLGRPAPLPDAECHLAANYGAVVDKMRALDGRDGQRKPIWNFVEVGCPSSNNGLCITGPQIRAAVWHSIIAGARGITYFNHSFSGPCQTQHALREPCYASQRAVVKATNEQIRNLAPVLNAPTVASQMTTSSGIRALYKWHNGHFYVFAGNRTNAATTGTMGLSCAGNATAVKLGEDGQRISVIAGAFTDEFADGNAIHIYRIDGGSTCGLAPGAGAGGGPDGAPGTPGVPRRTRVGRLPRRISLRAGRLAVPVACATRCKVRSRLTTRIASRRVLLAAARRRFGAGRHKLVLRLSRLDRRRVARHRIMRLRTIIVESGGKKTRRTQRLVARRH